jgi:hypothetical protein
MKVLFVKEDKYAAWPFSLWDAENLEQKELFSKLSNSDGCIVIFLLRNDV